MPDENVLGEVNKGFAIARDRVARQRIPYAAGCIGVAIVAQADGDRLRQAALDLRRSARDAARRSSG